MALADFFNIVRPLFSGGRLTERHVEGMEAIYRGCARAGLRPSHGAYAFATAFHETGQRMVPIREAFAKSDEQMVARLEAWYKRDKPSWISKPYWRFDADGQTWAGRGLVQITHKENYRKLGDLLGVPLTKNPNLALDLDVAVDCLIVGSQKGLYRGGHTFERHMPRDVATREEFTAARGIINGDVRRNGPKIADYALTFQRAILASGGASAPTSEQAPDTAPLPPLKWGVY